MFLERVLPRSLLEAHFPPTEASSSPLYGQMAIKCVSLDWKPLNDSFFSAGSALARYYSTESHRAPYRWLRTPFWLKQVIRQRGSSVAGEPFGGFPSSALKSLNCKSYVFVSFFHNSQLVLFTFCMCTTEFETLVYQSMIMKNKVMERWYSDRALVAIKSNVL